MNILITGGAGFIGSNLSRRLVKKVKNNVTLIDSLITGKASNVSKEVLFRLGTIETIEPNLYNVYNQIYNLACPASPEWYKKYPEETISASVTGVQNMLNLTRINKAVFLQASTSEVYGDPDITPQKESYFGRVNPIGERSNYDEGKRCAESLCFVHHRKYGTKIKVARIFNTFGPYLDIGDGRVVSNFIVQALKGDPITIYGDGTQTRSFCYVDDTVDGLIKLMNTPDEITGPINIGNPNEITILTLASVIRELTKSNSKIVFKPATEDDPYRRCPDISLAQEVLNWTPQIDLKTGLLKTIEFLKAKIVNTKM
jgi:UDP-glucuronate decarboxylase